MVKLTGAAKKGIFDLTSMKFGSVLFFALPAILFAENEIFDIAEAVENKIVLEEEITQIQASDSLKVSEITQVTESEFSGNPAIDSLDAGNDENAFSAAEEDSLQAEESSPQTIAENTELNDDSTATDEKEMSQDEADAELAAATESAAADSSIADSLQKLVLDMTHSAIPTESRRISGAYGIRTYRMHRGIDLGLCHGEDRTIVAAFAGKVKLVRNQGRRRGYGKYVVIDHGNGLTTLYAHLAKWTVKIGDEVMAGDTIGVGGNTGRSFGAHLHFEMKYKGVYIDPTTVFNFQEGTYLAANTEIDPVQIQSVEDDYQKELSKHRYYKVRRGDCLGKIARKYGISVGKLKRLNGLRSNNIRPGQVLKCS